MDDPVPAIAEAAATGEIAEIFADIRRVLGVDNVNLIWRHLATIPDALPWAWSTLRPLYVDGTIVAEAAMLHRDIDLPRLPTVPPEVFAALGLGGDDIAAIRNILAAYDHTNAMAIIALSALLAHLEHKAAAFDGALPHRRPEAPEPSATIALPRLLSLTDLPPATAGLVTTLNGLGTRRSAPILASMYRHLAHWPCYLALAWSTIAPLDADGRLDRAITEVVVHARARARSLAPRLSAPAAVLPAPATGAAVRAAVEPFTGDVIAKMVVICAVLRATSDVS